MTGIQEGIRPTAEESAKVSCSQVDCRVTVITPTYKRDPRILKRAMGCMLMQTVEDWEMLVCSDGGNEPEARAVVEDIGDSRITYHHLDDKVDGDYGNRCRSRMLSESAGEFILFLDDDNIVLPDYLEKMIHAVEKSQRDFAVCYIMHFGPLNESVVGKPPLVLKGDPVSLYHIDPLQVLVRRGPMQDVGWDIDRGYLADGHTLEQLGNKYQRVLVPEVLGIHT